MPLNSTTAITPGSLRWTWLFCFLAIGSSFLTYVPHAGMGRSILSFVSTAVTAAAVTLYFAFRYRYCVSHPEYVGMRFPWESSASVLKKKVYLIILLTFLVAFLVFGFVIAARQK